MGMPSEYLNRILARWTSLIGAFRDCTVFFNSSCCSLLKTNLAFWVFRGIKVSKTQGGNPYATEDPETQVGFEQRTTRRVKKDRAITKSPH
jgi:hypothetical protein